MKDLVYLLPIVVACILVWFTYLIVNYVATVIKTKKKDDTMVCGVSSTGKVFYGIITVIYLVSFVYTMYYIITNLLAGNADSIYLPLNILTIGSFVYYYCLQLIIFFGQRQVLIGRVIFDYRKIKRVTYPKARKLRFTYGQKTLETNTTFIDDSLLKKSLQRSR